MNNSLGRHFANWRSFRDAPDTMNPDGLRKWLASEPLRGNLTVGEYDCGIAFAGAWEADIKDARVYEKMANHNADVIDAKQARIKALEHDLVLMRTDRDAAEYRIEALQQDNSAEYHIEALELDLARIQNDRELWRGEMGVLQCRIEELEKQTRLMAGTLSTFGRYSTMHPDEVLAEFAALAGEE